MNDLLRTLLRAETAAYALAVVDLSYIAVHMDSFLRAYLCTHSTSYTADLAYVHNSLALVLISTVNSVLGLGRHKLDKLTRTNLDTCLACRTFGLINLCDTINDMHCVKGTGLNA